MAAQECRDPGDPDAAVRDVGGLHGDDLLTGDSTASVREQSGGVDSAEKRWPARNCRVCTGSCASGEWRH